MNEAPLSVAEALARTLALASPLPPEDCALVEAGGRVLARDVVASRDLPGFDNSQVDGYAVALLADALAIIDQPFELRLVGTLAAGSRGSLSIQPGECVRVFTGGPLPDGANAVVMQEKVTSLGTTHVRLQASVERGQFIRRRGSDVRADAIALQAGDTLTPAAIGLLTSLGDTTATIHRMPRVALFSSGDELVAPGIEPGLNQQIEGNTTMLASALRAEGITNVPIARERDDAAAIRASLSRLLEDHDLVLISGGVSVGDHDHIKPVLAELGVETVFWRVRQRPGKPLFVGTRGKTIVVGLPGNPVSTLACYYLYAVPVIRRMQGRTDVEMPRVSAVLSERAKGLTDLTHFMRGELRMRGDEAWVTPLGGQGSHQLRPFALANCLIVLPERDGWYERGMVVECVVV